MSWIQAVNGATAFERVLGQRPELLDRYRRFYRTFWEDGLAPRDLLEICRLRVAAVHDCEAEWKIRDRNVDLTADQLAGLRRGDFTAFRNREQTALAIAERISFQHHQITDEEVAALQTLIGSPGAVALLTALAFFDVTCRLKLVLEIPAEDHVLDSPPLLRGGVA